jgi:predicted ATP-grasp superfamily ATP-dependent carboligase
MEGVSGLYSHLMIIGASARAAAFSALRAGLHPYCADLFADVDLQARCPVRRLAGRYPGGFEIHLGAGMPGPWMYTGALENYPKLIAGWQHLRPLWGVRGERLAWVRDPVRVAGILRDANLPAPKAQARPPGEDAGAWLVKARRGAGGAGVREWLFDDNSTPSARVYWQEYIDGQPAAAVFAGFGNEVVLLGVTRQLVGVDWLHAGRFQYCGSVGPLQPPAELRRELIAVGEALGKRCNLAGLFGVDGVLAGGHFWPVEVNPRYTASVEVVEYATGLRALAWHRLAFDRNAPEPSAHPMNSGFVGKAILFAPDDLTFPADGPWLSELRSPTPLELPPAFADIPAAGEVIPRGRPILTFFISRPTLEECEPALRAVADDLTRSLFPERPAGAAPLQAADARIVSRAERFLRGTPNAGDPR